MSEDESRELEIREWAKGNNTTLHPSLPFDIAFLICRLNARDEQIAVLEQHKA